MHSSKRLETKRFSLRRRHLIFSWFILAWLKERCNRLKRMRAYENRWEIARLRGSKRLSSRFIRPWDGSRRSDWWRGTLRRVQAPILLSDSLGSKILMSRSVFKSLFRDMIREKSKSWLWWMSKTRRIHTFWVRPKFRKKIGLKSIWTTKTIKYRMNEWMNNIVYMIWRACQKKKTLMKKGTLISLRLVLNKTLYLSKIDSVKRNTLKNKSLMMKSRLLKSNPQCVAIGLRVIH